MKRRGYLWCIQPDCIKASRLIREGQPWHVAHDESGTQFMGAAHAECNVRDGAVRARARQLGTDTPQRWSL